MEGYGQCSGCGVFMVIADPDESLCSDCAAIAFDVGCDCMHDVSEPCYCPVDCGMFEDCPAVLVVEVYDDNGEPTGVQAERSEP